MYIQSFWGWRYHLQSMVTGLTEIADGLVRLLSFGFVHSNWSFKVTVYFTRKACKRILDEKK